MGRNDLLSGLILTVISIFSIWYALGLPQGITKMGVLQPGVFPLFLSIGLLVFSMILTIQGYASFRRSDKMAKINIKQFLSNKSFLFFIGVFFYFTMIVFLGFLISTIITTFITVYLIFKHKLVYSILISLSISIGTYIIFQTLLNISLPKGFF
jgi:putative tricarboxylic transport membrane protein